MSISRSLPNCHKRDLVFPILRACAALLILLSIWWPKLTHFQISRAWPESTTVERLGREPAAATLGEISRMTLAIPLGIPDGTHPEAARRILEGWLDVPEFAAAPIRLKGWPDDLAQEGVTFQLVMASLAVEDLLLAEYERSGERRHYLHARDRILAFADWEADRREPFGFLWNDHAVAARIPVLARLWLHLRSDPGATAEQKSAVIALVERSGELLAKDSQFTVRTNHGVMQNLALLQIGAAFPGLPKADHWRRLAMERLELQLGFYVSDEGVILEHSAEYHVFGAELLAYALRLARLNALDPPPRLMDAVRGTAEFTGRLLRPDGTLPLIGNSAAGHPAAVVAVDDSGTRPLLRRSPPYPQPPAGSHLYPLSGYAIWWSTAPVASQVAIAWAIHDRHGHKHADEPSLHFWSRGHDWITGTGYWPYDQRGYAQVNGWLGANAPHALDEGGKSPRSVQLLGTGDVDGIRIIDVENTRRSGLKIRRQVLQLTPERLLVLDTVSGATQAAETLWTVDPRLTLRQVGPQRFATNVTDGGHLLQVDLAGAAGRHPTTTLHRGDWSPFAGWVVVGRKPTPAASLRALQDSPSSITATLFSVTQAPLAVTLDFLDATSADQWSIDLGDAAGPLRITRRGTTVSLATDEKSAAIELKPPAALAGRHAALTQAMTGAIDRYPPWRELGVFRHRLYLAIPALWVALELALALLAWRKLKPRWLDGGLLAGWVAFGWWLHAHYLV